MHFAYPPRKSSNPPPYLPKGSRSPWLRQRRVQNIALAVVGGIFFLFILSKLLGSGQAIPSGTPPVVLVTTVEPERSQELSNKIKENRRQYAELHGTWYRGLGIQDTGAQRLTFQDTLPSSLTTLITTWTSHQRAGQRFLHCAMR